MRIKRILRPGDPGTKELMRKFGDDLVCVRYRYDEVRGVRLTTVELVVDRSPWQPDSNKIPANKKMAVRVEYGELQLAMQVKQAGGRWNREKRAWEISFDKVKELGLENRVI